jgi:hypothetical protein
MIKWEYKFAEVSAETDECIRQLDKLGRLGWELITLEWEWITRAGSMIECLRGIALFKRPKANFGFLPEPAEAEHED